MTLSVPALLRFAVAQKASDLHLSAGEPPMLRIHGDIHRIDMPPLAAEQTHRLIFDTMNDAQRPSNPGGNGAFSPFIVPTSSFIVHPG